MSLLVDEGQFQLRCTAVANRAFIYNQQPSEDDPFIYWWSPKNWEVT